LHFDNEHPSHSVYPGSILPVQENVTLENVKLTSSEMGYLMRSNTPVQSLVLRNCDLGHARMVMYRVDVPDVHYGKGDITLEKLSFTPKDEKPMIVIEDGLDIAVIDKNQ
jgi:hypothetical protein